MLHVYLFDTQGSAESIAIAKELIAMKLPDVRVLPVSAAPIREKMVAHGGVPLVPCVVSADPATGAWRDVYTSANLVSQFLEPLRAATSPPPPPQPVAPPPPSLSVAEIAQRMNDERESELAGSRRGGRG